MPAKGLGRGDKDVLMGESMLSNCDNFRWWLTSLELFSISELNVAFN